MILKLTKFFLSFSSPFSRFNLSNQQALLSLFYLCSSNIFALINYVGFATWVTITTTINVTVPIANGFTFFLAALVNYALHEFFEFFKHLFLFIT